MIRGRGRGNTEVGDGMVIATPQWVLLEQWVEPQAKQISKYSIKISPGLHDYRLICLKHLGLCMSVILQVIP